jgi:hypothetical protein
MTKAFESIKAGLKEAIAHQKNKPNAAVAHNVAPRGVMDKRVDAQRKTSRVTERSSLRTKP